MTENGWLREHVRGLKDDIEQSRQEAREDVRAVHGRLGRMGEELEELKQAVAALSASRKDKAAGKWWKAIGVQGWLTVGLIVAFGADKLEQVKPLLELLRELVS